jgi:predicted GNAT superfamily acetyltransferase
MLEGSASANELAISIRAPHGIHELGICVDLQRQIWAYSEIDIVPEQMFTVARESGGQVLLAFDHRKAVGFALAFAGVHDRSVYLHSHMVGVVPDYQNKGIGRLLKFAQRDGAIARGIDLIEWTFDPLQLRNAHFNLVRLGAVVRRYLPNFYGRTSSPLHAGLPTDRLVAEWWIRSARVQDLLDGKLPVPARTAARISLPSTIRQICGSNPEEAEKIQLRVRAQFEKHIANGRAAVGFEFDEQQGDYVLEPYED